MNPRLPNPSVKAGLIMVLLFLNLSTGPAVAREFDPEIGAKLEGNFVQGGLLFGTTVPGAKVSINGTPVRVSDQGQFLIGFGRDAESHSTLSVVYPDEKSFTSEIQISEREYQVQRIDGLPPSQVSPSQENLVRIQQDVAEVKAARRTDDARTDFLEKFDWPIQGIITGVYGSQRILNGEPRRPHYGIDIAEPVGTPVNAPASGLVTVDTPDMFF